MAKALEDDFALVARWREVEARNTYENAVFSSRGADSGAWSGDPPERPSPTTPVGRDIKALCGCPPASDVARYATVDADILARDIPGSVG